MSAVHQPFDDDGVTYCGWDGHSGCGNLWPCATERLEARVEQRLWQVRPLTYENLRATARLVIEEVKR